MFTKSREAASQKWPKRLPALTPEQLRIKDEFMLAWHEMLPRRYSVLERFNHGYPAGQRPKRAGRLRTLEIGAGIGGHLAFENLADQDYYAVELRPEMAERLKSAHPHCRVSIGDCQRHLDFPDSFFDRALAIHVLEHLPDLPAALREIHRVLKGDGQFCVVIPCEGGLAYGLARAISTRPAFRRRYRQSFDWFIRSEHINLPAEIEEELTQFFTVVHRRYFPLIVPLTTLNLCLGLTLTPAPTGRSGVPHQ
jgi:SAM-dependent methyltransferase